MTSRETAAASFAQGVVEAVTKAVEEGSVVTLSTELDKLQQSFLKAFAPGGSVSPESVIKSDDQQIVWGWASVSTIEGMLIADGQGDRFPTVELQKAAHDFMQQSRIGKVMHAGRRKGYIVDSIVFTKSLQDALGIDLGMEGWFVGYKVEDPDTWQRVKKGELRAFSIGGIGNREPIAKFNPHHDARGRFASAGAGASGGTGGGGGAIAGVGLGRHGEDGKVREYGGPAAVEAHAKALAAFKERPGFSALSSDAQKYHARSFTMGFEEGLRGDKALVNDMRRILERDQRRMPGVDQTEGWKFRMRSADAAADGYTSAKMFVRDRDKATRSKPEVKAFGRKVAASLATMSPKKRPDGSIRVKRSYFYRPDKGLEGFVERVKSKLTADGLSPDSFTIKASDNWAAWPKNSYFSVDIFPKT